MCRIANVAWNIGALHTVQECTSHARRVVDRAASIVIKPIAAALTVRILGKPWSLALPVGATFSQVGEFSFVLGTVARSLGLIDASGFNALVAAAIISIAFNPVIYRRVRHWSSQKSGENPIRSGVPQPIDTNRCILVGFGPVGRIVHRILLDQGKHVTIVDMNLETVRAQRDAGFPAIYGDALRPGLLEDAGVATAQSLILSADVEDAIEIVRAARLLNPELRILVRCAHLRDAKPLRDAGATVVAAGEAEVGVVLAEAVMSVEQDTCGAKSGRQQTLRQQLYGTTA